MQNVPRAMEEGRGGAQLHGRAKVTSKTLGLWVGLFLVGTTLKSKAVWSAPHTGKRATYGEREKDLPHGARERESSRKRPHGGGPVMDLGAVQFLGRSSGRTTYGLWHCGHGR